MSPRHLLWTAALIGFTASPTLAQTSEDRIRANEQMLRDQQVQQQLNTLEQRQTNLDIQLRSEQNLRQMQDQSLRAAPPLVLPSYASTSSRPYPPLAAPPVVATAAPVLTPDDHAAAAKKAKAKKGKKKTVSKGVAPQG